MSKKYIRFFFTTACLLIGAILGSIGVEKENLTALFFGIVITMVGIESFILNLHLKKCHRDKNAF